MRYDDNAQLYTIEGIASAVLLVMVIIFVVRAAPMTPNASSFSHQYLEGQLETKGEDLLTILDYTPEGSLNSPLKEAVINWNGMRFEGQARVVPEPVNYTAMVLKEVLADAGIAYNLELTFNTSSGSTTYGMLWNGKPSDNAVTVSRKIAIHDEDMTANPQLRGIIPDADSSATRFYSIADVRLTLWRM